MAAPRVHVLYVESAEDQRGTDGARVPGLHLRVPGLGPTLCGTCGSVADSWRGRLDNFQCTLRMCCAEGQLFRPCVSQVALISPRAALNYSLPELGAWMHASGRKRPNEALLIGAALREADPALPAVHDGVTYAELRPDTDAMWEWVSLWAQAVRDSAAGRVVPVLLDAKAPPLAPSAAAGALATAIGARARPISDLLFILGGPSGIPSRWQQPLLAAVGAPIRVALRGGLAHSAPALLELLLLHERHELLPLLLDREVLSPAQLKRWHKMEREVHHAWLRALGVHAQDSQPAARPSEALPGTRRRDPFEDLLQAHQAVVARMRGDGPDATEAAAPAKTKRMRRT